MLKFLSKIIKFNNLLVLGVYKTDDGDMYYSLVIKKKGNTLNIVSSSVYSDLEALVKAIDLNLPVLVLIDGKGILNKKIDINNEIDITWKKNLDFNTIYYTDYKASNATYLSFSRKKTVDEIITNLQKKGLQLIDFYLGPLPSVLLFPTIKESILHSNDTLLKFEQHVLFEITKQTDSLVKNYTLGDKQISQYHLPLYGAVIHFFLKQKDISKNESVNINTEEIIYKKSFNYFGVGMLVAFFMSLLMSYFLIQYYSAQNIDLNQQNVFSNQTYQQIIKLEAQKEQKMKILNETGQLSKNFLSFYVYKLSASVSPAVQINNLNVFPLSKEIKENEKVSITSNYIFIKGSTKSESSFDDWLSKLKEMKWIRKFEIVSLKKDKKNVQQFEIKILLNDV